MDNQIRETLQEIAERDSPNPDLMLVEIRRCTLQESTPGRARLRVVQWRRPALVATAIAVVLVGALGMRTALDGHRPTDTVAASAIGTMSVVWISGQPAVSRSPVEGEAHFRRPDGSTVDLGRALSVSPVPGSTGPNPYLVVTAMDANRVIKVDDPGASWTCSHQMAVADTLYCQTGPGTLAVYADGQTSVITLPTLSPADPPVQIDGRPVKAMGYGLVVVNAVIPGPDGSPVALLSDSRRSAVLNLKSGRVAELSNVYSAFDSTYAVSADGSLYILGLNFSDSKASFHLLRVTNTGSIVGDWNTSAIPNAASWATVLRSSITAVGSTVVATITTNAAQSDPWVVNVWTLVDNEFSSRGAVPANAGSSAIAMSADSLALWGGPGDGSTMSTYSLSSKASQLNLKVTDVADSIVQFVQP